MLNIAAEKYRWWQNSDPEMSEKDAEKFCRKTLFMVLLCWNIFWLAVPMLVIPGIYFDVLENIEWGRYWQFGYDKHPFVSMWITRFFYELTGTASVMYLLNQISISCAVVCVWLLARKFVKPLPALAAALMTLTLQYYSSWALEFNNDVIAISVWGAAALFFYNAVTKQHIKYWLLTAFFCAVALMTKYYAIVLLCGMALVVVGHRRGRESFRHAGIYLAAGLFLGLIIPNMIFLVQNDFLPFQYATDSAAKYEGFFHSRLMSAFDLIGVISGRLGFFIGVYLLLFFRSKPHRPGQMTFNRFFVIAVGMGPLLITLLFPLLTGGRIKATWLASCFSLLAVLLFMYLRPVITKRSIQMLIFAIGLFGVILAGELAFSKGIKLSYYKRGCGYEAFPGDALSREITNRWRSRYNTPLKYVIANRRDGCNVAYYAEDNPSAFYFADPRISPWIDVSAVEFYGGVIVWEIEGDEPENMLPEFCDNLGEIVNDIVLLEPIVLERVTTPWSRLIMQRSPKTIKMGMAFLPPFNANGNQ